MLSQIAGLPLLLRAKVEKQGKTPFKAEPIPVNQVQLVSKDSYRCALPKR